MLRAATPRTLLILDELGRGTSTHDGVAIAIATLDWLVLNPGKGLTLFVTHYPEVARLAEASQGAIGNYHMGFLQDKGGPPGGAPDLTFLYQVRAGVCAKSFGLNVAALAAIPRSVVARAREVHALMERTKRSAAGFFMGKLLTIAARLGLDAMVGQTQNTVFAK